MAESADKTRDDRSVSGPRRVLACFDGSELGERALPHALALARAFDAPLTLLRVLERSSTDREPPDPLQWEIRRKEAREYLDELAARSDVATTESELIEGRAAEEICRWSADRDVDVTVATTHGEGGRSPWALASTARKLLERAPGSLLLVPSSVEPVAGVARYTRVLVPLDGSPEAELALPIAARIALAHGAELIAVHVVPAPELTQTGPLDSEDLALVDRLRRRNERAASAYLDRARARLSEQNVAARVLLLTQNGDVGGRVAGAAAAEHADLIVVAAHGRNARRTLPCGNATAELIARRPGPLLIVRGRQPRTMRRVATLEPTTALRLPHHAAP